MLGLKLFLIFVLMAIGWFLIAQVGIPLALGLPIFPIFRSPPKKDPE